MSCEHHTTPRCYLQECLHWRVPWDKNKKTPPFLLSLYQNDLRRGLQYPYLHKPAPSHARVVDTIKELLEQTLRNSHSFAALLCAPPLSGKTMLARAAFSAVGNEHVLRSINVRCHLFHDDTNCLRYILSELVAITQSTSNGVIEVPTKDIEKWQFSRVYEYIKRELRALHGNYGITVCFVLHNIERFVTCNFASDALETREQLLLYSLFDLQHDASFPVAILAMSPILQIFDTLEKRVQSRLTVKTIFVPQLPPEELLDQLKERLLPAPESFPRSVLSDMFVEALTFAIEKAMCAICSPESYSKLFFEVSFGSNAIGQMNQTLLLELLSLTPLTALASTDGVLTRGHLSLRGTFPYRCLCQLEVVCAGQKRSTRRNLKQSPNKKRMLSPDHSVASFSSSEGQSGAPFCPLHCRLRSQLETKEETSSGGMNATMGLLEIGSPLFPVLLALPHPEHALLIAMAKLHMRAETAKTFRKALNEISIFTRRYENAETYIFALTNIGAWKIALANLVEMGLLQLSMAPMVESGAEDVALKFPEWKEYIKVSACLELPTRFDRWVQERSLAS